MVVSLPMESHKITAFLLTGPPGVGKTTLVRKLCDKLAGQSALQGFYTVEVRGDNGVRKGFDVVTLNGARGILARETSIDKLQRPKVGKYAVYIQDFEELALPMLEVTSSEPQLLVIDEIGKMELLSKRFETAINSLLQKQHSFLATIPQQTRQPIPLVERLKSAPFTRVYQVTKHNRDNLVNEITENIANTFFIMK